MLPRKKAWCGFSDLFTGGAGTPGVFPGGGPQQSTLQALFEEEPGYYSLEFSVASLPVDPGPGGPGNVSGIFQATAIINWKVEGNKNQRIITVGNGVTISGLGQGVDVAMLDNTPVFATTNLKYTITATLSKGVRPFTSNPPTLFGLAATNVAASGAVAVPIPPNCGISSVEVNVSPTVPAVQPNVVVAHRNAATIFKSYDPQKNIGFVDLAPNCTQVRISNLDPANAVTVSLVWGIDG
jgi:hypothetical protein